MEVCCCVSRGFVWKRSCGTGAERRNLNRKRGEKRMYLKPELVTLQAALHAICGFKQEIYAVDAEGGDYQTFPAYEGDG